MISLIPRSTETLVAAWESTVVARRLADATVERLLVHEPVPGKEIYFTGRVSEDRFYVSLKLTRPNSFVPIVSGSIEPTSSGCIIFLQYRLFPSVRLFLTFWIILTFFFGVLLSFEYKNLWFISGSIAIAALILFVAWGNFRIQRKLTREALRKVLE